jgi:hypothetical protein
MLDDVPIRGVISDGQHSIRKAVQTVLPDVPHQLCHFHYLREAAKSVYEADRHAKKELKKHIRGVRPIERAVEKRKDVEAEAIRGILDRHILDAYWHSPLADETCCLNTLRRPKNSYCRNDTLIL